MCGIVGYLGTERSLEAGQTWLRERALRLQHRGPDQHGSWVHPKGHLGLGHRRLSILDLSPLGQQPMASPCGRLQLTFNGEIYNFANLRSQLESKGHSFRGTSDTEILLAAFLEWGVQATLPKLNGMFALGLWDESSQTLTLARDRYGKKPLYYGQIQDNWVFASELKALHQLGLEVDRQALNGYLRSGFVSAPASIYRGIFKLPAASWLVLKSDTTQPHPQSYWSLASLRRDLPLSLDFPQALQEFEAKLSEAVRLRMVADVPLGAFLSGGIDSSLIVTLMQKLSPRPIRTFCIGFQEASHDESGYARQVAQALGCQHTERLLTAQETLDVIPLLATMFDEPLGDPSQIPTYLVSQLARQEVTVALSGDGGDEVFGGYNRYLWGPKVWNALRPWPLALRRSLAHLLGRLPARQLANFLPRVSYPEEKMTKLLNLLRVSGPSQLYQQLLWAWDEDLVEGIRQPQLKLPLGDLACAMMEQDALNYLPDDILVKVDRASMAVSLECRAPLLDQEVAELAWRLPLAHKIKGNKGKLLMRALLDKHLPAHLFERPKAGFSLPLGEWLRGPLRDWAESLLQEERLKHQGYLRSQPIRQRWQQHLSGHRNWSASLWHVLQFQAWLEVWS